MRLEQIVTNLVTNAIKYTPAGGTITITAGAANGAAVIAVEDTGIGMAPELIERVFDLFVQGQRSPARSEGGLGIGLTLVKRLVEMHGGTIQAASAGPGRGSRFTVRLPTAVMPAKAESRSRPTITATPSGHRVLVVEDNDDVRDMLRLLLELDGHEVHEAADGYAGLHAALDLSPDIAFVDIGLPGVDGYELVRQLRAKRGSERTMLVAVTGYGRAEDRDRIRAAGFQAHLVKPVDPDAVRGVIATAPRFR